MGNRLSSITTRTGDDGTTGLADGSRLAKNDLRVHAMGDVDELNSHIGLILTEALPERLATELTHRLMQRYGRGGFLHFGQGKWYPGEQLPRWALSVVWRADGQPCWHDPSLLADMRYTLSAEAFDPIWGIRFTAPGAPTEVVWIDRARDRRVSPADMWREIRGEDPRYRPLP